ncbi:MAG: DUF697 domain-containing protein [Actinobacteria bacterium]|nr:DUF697 domain-containing protein [Actinomycetota bacterium]
MAIIKNFKRVRSVTKAINAVRGEVEERVSIAVIAESQVEAELSAILQLEGEGEVVFGLNSLPGEKRKEARLRDADLALAAVSPNQSREDLLAMLEQASLTGTRLVVVTGREINDWSVKDLTEIFRVSGEDVTFIPFSDKAVMRTILVPKIVDKLAKKQIALAATLPVFREEVAKRTILETAKQNALIGVAVFVPGADMPLLTLNQIKMILRLAAIYNQELSAKRLSEVLATVGGGFAFREAARQLVSLVPVAGWAVKGGVAYGGTLVMGQLAKKYFEREKGEVLESLATDRADIKQGGEAESIYKS